MNPFLLKGYKAPDYFCNRDSEAETIRTALNNQQDITLFAIRRIGKSALIHHVFYDLSKECHCIYSDIWGTTSLNEFINELANAVIRSKLFSGRNIGKKITDFIKSIGASLRIGDDGRPILDIMYHEKNQIFMSLEEILLFVNSSKKPVIFAIDEFQEINKYKDNLLLEAKFRSISQNCHNLNFIYSGSEYHLLTEIFSTYGKPFFQSTRMMELVKINNADYKEFIITKFAKNGKKINEELVDHILTITHTHTYYVQAVFNHLYSLSRIPSSVSEFDVLYYDFLSEKKVFYSEFPYRLSRQQFTTVKAFAFRGIVSSPTSADFIELADVKTASSMQRIMNSLLKKQVIIKEQDGFRLYDVFLEHYLRYAALK